MPSMLDAISIPSGDLITNSRTSNKSARDKVSLGELLHHLESAGHYPPQNVKSPKDFTDELLQERKEYVDKIEPQSVLHIPNLLRFSRCYKYYLATAQKVVTCADLERGNGCMKQPQNSTLQACRQILSFDESQCMSDNHPCDVPVREIGRRYMICTVIMLKYVIYTRYQCYLGRRLNSFSVAVGQDHVKMWRDSYAVFRYERETSVPKSRRLKPNQQQLFDEKPMTAASQRLNNLLRLRPMTVENAIESLENYSRHRFSVFHDRWKNVEVPTYELENLVQKGRYVKLAQMLHADFVALDNMLQFENEDLDVFHLQAVVASLIQVFFNVDCVSGNHGYDNTRWKPTSVLDLQKYFLRNGDRRFEPHLKWRLKMEAQRAEKKFSTAWTALCSGTEESEGQVQELLRTYLQTLEVEYVDAEKAVVDEGRINSSDNIVHISSDR